MIRAQRAALVVAVALAGVGACDRSSPSAPTPNCAVVSLTPTTLSFTGGTGTGAIDVAIQPGCAWSATASAPWITITSGGSGTGPGTLAFSILANPRLTPRTGSIAVGGSQSSISQAGTPNDPGCRFELRPQVRSVPAVAINFLVQVFTTFGCRWEFSSTLPWLQIVAETEGAPNGNGNGSVEAHVAANPDPAPRTGQALVAGQVLNVTQDGQSIAACTYGIDPAAVTAPAAGAMSGVNIAAGSGCSWWVEAEQGSVGWITFSSGGRGFGSATVPYLIASNQTSASRTANVVVHGDSGYARLVQTVTQSAAGPVAGLWGLTSPARRQIAQTPTR